MNPLVLKDPGLHLMLLAIDEELAADTRALGCRQCGEKRKECVTASARAIRQIHIESPLRLARNSQSVRIKQGFKWCRGRSRTDTLLRAADFESAWVCSKYLISRLF
jgi:hypothetical protein